MEVQVRCPAEECKRLFPVPARKLGRSTTCPQCGERMTARPPEIEERLRQQELVVKGGAGETHPRVERLDFVVLLDNIRSAWNVGSIFRTADGCGVRKLHLCGITATPPRADIAKTALGADQAVAWEYHAFPQQAIEQVIEEGYTPVVLENGEAQSLSLFEWPRRICLVIGNEVAGVSVEVMQADPCRVSIPMMGVKNSFNVAVAFGIAAYSAGQFLCDQPVATTD